MWRKRRFAGGPQEASFIVFTGIWAERAGWRDWGCENVDFNAMRNLCTISGGWDAGCGFDNRLEYGAFERVILGGGGSAHGRYDWAEMSVEDESARADRVE
jgi:hypothetical protein